MTKLAHFIITIWFKYNGDKYAYEAKWQIMDLVFAN